MLDADAVAEQVSRAVSEGRFLVTPHENVVTYMQRMAADHGRWLKGMQRQHAKFGDAMMRAPNSTAAKL